MRILLVLMIVLLPVAATAAECGSNNWIESTLYMGRGQAGGGSVTDTEVQAFVDQEIVRQFPDGFTLFNAHGHWRDSVTSRTIQETTLVLVVLHPPGSAAEAALRTIAESYADRFGQSAVLGSNQPTCVTFYEPKK